MKKSAFHPAVLPVFSLLLLLLAGCAGYHVGPVQPTFMAGIKTIAVPNFKNSSLIPRIEVLVADAVIQQIQQDGTYKIASSENADAILEGTITAVTRSPMRSLRENVLTTTEFQLTVSLSWKVIRRDTGEVIETRAVEGTTTYYVGNDQNEGERQAIPLAVQEAAVRLVSQLSEGW